MKLRTTALFGLCAAAFAVMVVAGNAQDAPQEVAILQQQDPPPNGIWIDSLDLTAVQPLLRRGGRGGGNRAAGAAPATPPPPRPRCACA